MMKDEERQAATFEGTHQHFHVVLKLTPDSESLDIKVENSLTRKRYCQIIDHTFIASR
jgi:hypothetical protein